MTKAYLLLGSNEGDRLGLMQDGMEQISKTCGKIVGQSRMYETAAWGLEEQPDFLNMAIIIDTPLQPIELLKAIHDIEQNLGRQRTLKWGQRTLDIDILFFGQHIINIPELTIPHPSVQLRRFALVPLNEIASGFVHPVLNKTISGLLADCPDPLPVTEYKP